MKNLKPLENNLGFTLYFQNMENCKISYYIIIDLCSNGYIQSGKTLRELF